MNEQHKYSIFNLQTRVRRSPEFGECKPEDVDLIEHEEIHVMKDCKWIPLDPEPTPFEKAMMNIRAFTDAIHDELEKMEGML